MRLFWGALLGLLAPYMRSSAGVNECLAAVTSCETLC